MKMLLLCAQAAGSRRALSLRGVAYAPFASLYSTEASAKEIAKPPVLRFAPSPTGQLHLGGLRTALFNHLFARKHSGRWILRIEDTDRKRLVPGAVEAMQDTLRWAGLDYDEGPDTTTRDGTRGPYVQSERLELYKHYTDRLLASGHAYRDFRPASLEATTADVDGGRAKSRAVAEEYLAPDEDEARQLAKEGRPSVVRLKVPGRDTQLNDAVYGQLRFPSDRTHDDPILVKSDGWPTYHLASVVDDTDMGITHVLRGEEWLPSLPIHLALYDALNVAPPQFAHLPLLINADGSKLSKRHAAVHVDAYRKAGYEPESLVNFVALMGHNWHGTGEVDSAAAVAAAADTIGSAPGEVFTMDDMIAGFDMTRVSHSQACPDFDKLHFLNRQHILLKLQAPDGAAKDELLSKLLKKVDEGDDDLTSSLSAHQKELIADVVLSRSLTINEAAAEVRTLYATPSYDDKEACAMWDAIEPDLRVVALRSVHDRLSATSVEAIGGVQDIEAWLKDAGKAFEVAAAQACPDLPKKRRGRSVCMHALRFALMAKPAGPRVAEAMALLGTQHCLGRIEKVLRRCGEQAA